jgi:hypothetical protein
MIKNNMLAKDAAFDIIDAVCNRLFEKAGQDATNYV